MQRLISLKVASNFTRKLPNDASSFLHSHPHKTFTSLAKPTQKQNQTFFSHFIHSQSGQSHIDKIGFGFLSNPVILKQFLLDSSNSLSRVSRKSHADVRVRFLRAQFSRGNFGFNSSFGSNTHRWKSWFRGLSANDVVLGLIIANVAVFMLWHIADRRFMTNNFTISLDNFKSGRVHTLITSAFSHMDTEHIISNMIGLYFFGTSIASAFGPEFLLKLYLAGAVGGSVFYLVHHVLMATSSTGRHMGIMDPSRTPGLGASGAVNAIMLLNIFLFPRSTLYVDFFIPVPAILLGIFLIGKDTLRIIKGDSHISGSAHLGGAAVAAIAWARIRRGRY